MTSLVSLAASACSSAPSNHTLVQGAPVTGSENAEITIVEFGDYECNPCATLGASLHDLIEQGDLPIRLVYRHCPSSLHPVGRLAALVAASAPTPADFWRLHWQLVREGPTRSEEALWNAVRDAGLDEASLRATVHDERAREVVERDVALADRLGIRGTPTLFVDGRRYEGALSPSQLLRAVEGARAGRR